MIHRFRGLSAWLVAAVVLVAVIVFEILLWLFLSVVVIAGLVYELFTRLIRLVRREKPIERRVTNSRLEVYMKRKNR